MLWSPAGRAGRLTASRAWGAAPTPARRGRFDLTPREQEVLALVASGMSDGEIAASLVISKKTASVHVANIKAKLGASSRVEVATIALRERLT
jgi:DNA-binding NarL/FixJ family response regulator